MPYDLQFVQPFLFQVAETASGVVELFPAVWSAAEGLTAPDAGSRRVALDRLLALRAHRFSPLVAYLLATRITDPNLALRVRVIQALGELFVPDANGQVTPPAVHRHLAAYLAQMRTRPVFSLLEAVAAQPESADAVAHLLNACPYAGNHLAEILSERKNPLQIRRLALHFIAEIGYLDTLPTLERLANRLEMRLAGQTAMPFAPPAERDEASLLPDIQAALRRLNAR